MVNITINAGNYFNTFLKLKISLQINDSGWLVLKASHMLFTCFGIDPVSLKIREKINKIFY